MKVWGMLTDAIVAQADSYALASAGLAGFRPGGRRGAFNPCAPAVAASNCVVVVDGFLFVFIFGPTHTPRSLPPRRAEERANTTFGPVNKQRKYPRTGTSVRTDYGIVIASVAW